MNNRNFTKIQEEEIIDAIRSSSAVVGYLFGSYARGTAGLLSDIDVGVAFPKSTSLDDQSDKIEQIRRKLERIFGRDKVDVLNVPHLRSPLLRYLVTLGEGRLLFTDDISMVNTIADFARREYEDTKNLRYIQRAAVSNLFAS